MNLFGGNTNITKVMERKRAFVYNIYVETVYIILYTFEHYNPHFVRIIMFKGNGADKSIKTHALRANLHLCTFHKFHKFTKLVKHPTPEGRAVEPSEQGDADCAFTRRERNGVHVHRSKLHKNRITLWIKTGIQPLHGLCFHLNLTHIHF